MDRESKLIEETIKCFIANQWVITPEAIWGFLKTHGESVDKEKVARILQRQQTEGSRK